MDESGASQVRRIRFGKMESEPTMQREHRLKVNGRDLSVTTDADRPLLDVLREDLGLTGAKYGCGEGECGACTVLVNGRATRSCVTSIGEVAGRDVKTIESLAAGPMLHPVQQAFLDKQGMQCGYCVPGQILTAVELLSRNNSPSRPEIVEATNGNICRCCNYGNILSAVEHACELMASATKQGGSR
jgi:aerobic-type carbon monoxide dehydrogenase small subunit (CoxS/CutS family)